MYVEPSVTLIALFETELYPVIWGVAKVILNVSVFESLSGGLSLFVAVIVCVSEYVIVDCGSTIISPLLLLNVI